MLQLQAARTAMQPARLCDSGRLCCRHGSGRLWRRGDPTVDRQRQLAALDTEQAATIEGQSGLRRLSSEEDEMLRNSSSLLWLPAEGASVHLPEVQKGD